MMMGNIPMPPEETAAYLKTLPAIRERCGRVHALAQQGKLQYFDYYPEKEDDVAAFCAGLMKRDFGSDFAKIPPHGRWRHLDAGRSRIAPLIETWASSPNPPDKTEVTRRLLDLFLVSVLLDAGAGSTWAYKEKGTKYARSEGLGVASVHMFVEGFFSGVPGEPCRVDAKGLAAVTPERTAAAMQVSEANPMVGLDGRAGLLHKLSGALSSHPEYFGSEGRPGHLVDFLLTTAKPGAQPPTVHVSALWAALIDGLSSIWPARHTLGGVPLGDVWPCPALAAASPGGSESDALVPFHKLTGWTAYSLIEPLEAVLGWTVEGKEDMTGLPEYRNGGLLLDLGVLSLKPGALGSEFYPDGPSGIPRVPPSHPAIVEWRAMTVIELDRIADRVRGQLGLTPAQLSLAQVLESCTWKGGREVAKERRPETGGPPIDIVSDGTVF